MGVAEPGQVYAALSDAEPHIVRGLVVAPTRVAGFSFGVLLAGTIRQVGPAPADVPRITIYNPRAARSGVLLVERARPLAEAYAQRMAGGDGSARQVASFVLPQIILGRVYRMDTDPARRGPGRARPF